MEEDQEDRAIKGPEPAKEPDGFVVASEVAKKVHKCELTVRLWAKEGKIPSIKIGRSTLFHWRSVEQALIRMQRGGGR